MNSGVNLIAGLVPSSPIDVSYRTGTTADVAAISAILEAAHLPAREVEPFVETFMVAEIEGRVVACGGLEVHDDTAVIRSVAVAEEVRNFGIGRGLSMRLVGLALSYAVSDLYLFTADAAPFWQKLGFADIELDGWREPARACWQFGYVNEHREWAQSIGLRTMWMPASM